MNHFLLDPTKLPERIESTLSLPSHLLPHNGSPSCTSLSFSPQGHLATSHPNLLPIHSTRTLAALHSTIGSIDSLSWHGSRYLLAGSIGSSYLYWFDHSQAGVGEECAARLAGEIVDSHTHVVVGLPGKLAGNARIHPTQWVGCACLEDGRLVLFRPGITGWRFYEGYFVVGAVFGGDMLYCASRCGTLLVFKLDYGWRGGEGLMPWFVGRMPGGRPRHFVAGGGGRYVLVNSEDCALRLYNVEDFKGDGGYFSERLVELKPVFVFQDLVSKAQWAACDFSGDGEYVVGGCNSYPQPGDNYQLFLWSVVTGELLDQLTGPQGTLLSLSCHPTRPFIAVGTSDGLVDMWGPRMSWVAFAPDFQALQKNELYEEREDEFDVVVDDDEGEGGTCDVVDDTDSFEDEHVDIITKFIGPSFGDAGKDHDVYCFDTTVLKIMPDKPLKRVDQD